MKRITQIWLLILPLVVLFGCKEKGGAAAGASEQQAGKTKQIGEPLATDYFDVTVNDVFCSPKVRTGNPYTAVKANAGETFIILDITVKNTSQESRILTDGELVVKTGDKIYHFDKAETIMDDKYNLALSQINPLTSRTAKVVYRIPEDITAQVYYYPGRSSTADLIAIGELPMVPKEGHKWHKYFSYSGYRGENTGKFKVQTKFIKIDCKLEGQKGGKFYIVKDGQDWQNHPQPDMVIDSGYGAVHSVFTPQAGLYYIHSVDGPFTVEVSEP